MKTYRWLGLHPRVRTGIIGFIVLCFILGFVYVHYDQGFGGKHDPGREDTEQSLPTQERPDEIRVNVIDYYLGCHHHEDRTLEFSEADFRSFLSELIDDWEIRETDKKGTKILTMKIPGLCSICQNQEFLGIDQDIIVVYHGRPDRPGPVKEITKIKVLGLPENEIMDLKTGVTYEHEREKLLILEGYSELTQK